MGVQVPPGALSLTVSRTLRREDVQKKYFVKKLRDYKKRVKDWCDFIKDKKGTEFKTEQNTIVKFVIPLLEMLGWCPLSEA